MQERKRGTRLKDYLHKGTVHVFQVDLEQVSNPGQRSRSRWHLALPPHLSPGREGHQAGKADDEENGPSPEEIHGGWRNPTGSLLCLHSWGGSYINSVRKPNTLNQLLCNLFAQSTLVLFQAKPKTQQFFWNSREVAGSIPHPSGGVGRSAE